jgi:aminopeptidase YwaD
MSFRDLLAAVRAEVSGERAHDSVRSIANFHRVQSSPGYDDAARWLTGQLEAAGLVPEIENVVADGRRRHLGQLMPEGWECTHAEATLIAADGRQKLCDYADVKLSLVLRSDPARGRFPIVTVGDGIETEHYANVDVRGAVVFARGAVHRVHQLAVVERGAAGILTDGRRLFAPVRAADTDPDQIAYTSFWWGSDQPRGWGFVISPRAGEALRARLDRGERVELEVVIESRRFPTTIPIVSAAIPGSGAGEVLVISHLCHPQPSANDNASGAASNLETARVLRRLAASGAWSPQRSVRFLWIPEFTGTYAWLDADPSRAGGIAAALNLDMVGEDQEQCGSSLLIESPPAFVATFAEHLLADIRHAAEDAVGSYTGPGRFGLTRMSAVPYAGGSDHAVFSDPGIGVPCPMMIQWPDRYYHSSHDTPDRTDPRSLALAVRTAATWAGTLAAAGPAEVDAIAEITARRVRVAVLSAPAAVEPARELARAALAGRSAIASLARLGRAPDAVAADQERYHEFLEREAGWRLDAECAPTGPAPVRRFRAPLHYHRHLLAGFESLSSADREALRLLDRDTPDAHVVFELAWFLCDGRRDLDAIARAVGIETGIDARPAIEEFLAILGRLGALDVGSTTEDRWSSSPPATATH